MSGDDRHTLVLDSHGELFQEGIVLLVGQAFLRCAEVELAVEKALTVGTAVKLNGEGAGGSESDRAEQLSPSPLHSSQLHSLD